MIGRDRGFPVADLYQPPFPWNGTLHHVEMAAGPVPEREPGDELRSALHRE
jgi:hypothetical protein